MSQHHQEAAEWRLRDVEGYYKNWVTQVNAINTSLKEHKCLHQGNLGPPISDPAVQKN